MARMCELRDKEVINTKDGSRYGYITDVEIDIRNGCVIAIIINTSNRVLGIFGREQEYIIPWCFIKQIGDDIIIVECDTREIVFDCC